MDEPAFLAAVNTGYGAVRPETDLVCLGRDSGQLRQCRDEDNRSRR